MGSLRELTCTTLNLLITPLSALIVLLVTLTLTLALLQPLLH